MKNYEFILLDADGTLFDYDKAESYGLEKMLGTFNIEYSARLLDIYREKNSAIWKEFENKQIDAETLKSERFRRFFSEIGADADSLKAGKVYLDFLREAHFLLDGAVEAIAYLKSKYKICIITNGLTYVQEKRIGTSPVIKYADSLVISESVGIPKPYAGIFDYAFKSVGHENRNTAMIIGDSLSSDIKGGNNYGIDTCWIAPDDAEPDIAKPDFRINHINQIRTLL